MFQIIDLCLIKEIFTKDCTVIFQVQSPGDVNMIVHAKEYSLK